MQNVTSSPNRRQGPPLDLPLKAGIEIVRSAELSSRFFRGWRPRRIARKEAA